MHVTILTAKNARDNFWFALNKNQTFLPVKKNARDIFGDYEKMPVTPQESASDIYKKLKRKKRPETLPFLSEELCRRSYI